MKIAYLALFASAALIQPVKSSSLIQRAKDLFIDRNTDASAIFAKHREMANKAANEELAKCKSQLTKEQLKEFEYQINNSCVTNKDAITIILLNHIKLHFIKEKSASNTQQINAIKELLEKELQKKNIDADTVISEYEIKIKQINLYETKTEITYELMHSIDDGNTRLILAWTPTPEELLNIWKSRKFQRIPVKHGIVIKPYKKEIVESSIEHEINHIQNNDAINYTLLESLEIDTKKYLNLFELRTHIHGVTKNKALFKAMYPRYKLIKSDHDKRDNGYPSPQEIYNKLKPIQQELKQAKIAKEDNKRRRFDAEQLMQDGMRFGN